MALYAGSCSTDITPPLGVALSARGGPNRVARRIADPLLARALVLVDEPTRVVIISADLAAPPGSLAIGIRSEVARKLGTRPDAVWICCSGAAGSPAIDEDGADGAYLDVLVRKLIGAAVQAAERLEPVNITYGESTAQIGAPVQNSGVPGSVSFDLGAEAPAVVSVVCVNGLDGRLRALLFSHGCDDTAPPGLTETISAGWPGAASRYLEERFRIDSEGSAARMDAPALFLSGLGSDVRPLLNGDAADVAANGLRIANAAHTARWGAHGRIDDTLAAAARTVSLPRKSGAGAVEFPIHTLQLGGVRLMGYAAALACDYNADFRKASSARAVCVNRVNGNLGQICSAATTLEAKSGAANDVGVMFGSNAEEILRRTTYEMLEIDNPDLTPYAGRHGQTR